MAPGPRPSLLRAAALGASNAGDRLARPCSRSAASSASSFDIALLECPTWSRRLSTKENRRAPGRTVSRTRHGVRGPVRGPVLRYPPFVAVASGHESPLPHRPAVKRRVYQRPVYSGAKGFQGRWNMYDPRPAANMSPHGEGGRQKAGNNARLSGGRANLHVRVPPPSPVGFGRFGPRSGRRLIVEVYIKYGFASIGACAQVRRARGYDTIGVAGAMKPRSPFLATGAAAIAAFWAMAEIRPAQADEIVECAATIAQASRGVDSDGQDPRRTKRRRWRLNLNGRCDRRSLRRLWATSNPGISSTSPPCRARRADSDVSQDASQPPRTILRDAHVMLHGSFPIAVDRASDALGRWVSLRFR